MLYVTYDEYPMIAVIFFIWFVLKSITCFINGVPYIPAQDEIVCIPARHMFVLLLSPNAWYYLRKCSYQQQTQDDSQLLNFKKKKILLLSTWLTIWRIEIHVIIVVLNAPAALAQFSFIPLSHTIHSPAIYTQLQQLLQTSRRVLIRDLVRFEKNENKRKIQHSKFVWIVIDKQIK